MNFKPHHSSRASKFYNLCLQMVMTKPLLYHTIGIMEYWKVGILEGWVFKVSIFALNENVSNRTRLHFSGPHYSRIPKFQYSD